MVDSSFIYKYCPPERIDILRNGCIRFTQLSCLNDPFDLKPCVAAVGDRTDVKRELQKITKGDLYEIFEKQYESIPDEIKRHLPKESLYEQFRQTFESQRPMIEDMCQSTLNAIIPSTEQMLHSEIDKNIGILCLTETPTNVLMWSHYARDHKGFVIRFDRNHSFFCQRRSLKDEFGFLRKVCYMSNRPQINFSNTNAEECVLAKAQAWEYEKEWRMLMPFAFATKKIPAQGGDIHLFSLPVECITGIVLGAKMESATKNDFMKVLTEDARLGHIECMEAKLDDRTYSIGLCAVKINKPKQSP